MAVADRDQEVVRREAARRRTFAIISHPDAGKTTLTEKLLLYGGAVREAGQVQARGGRANAVSDWTELEQSRGISVTSTVLRFEHDDVVLNLLDTPGHRDFSEDTMRVLAAADCAVILLDVARGVQEQTRMLFEVARARGVPLITFVNKCDRPGMEPLEMLDHIERELGLAAAPMSWPVGDPGALVGLLDRREDRMLRLFRTPRGSLQAPEVDVSVDLLDSSERVVWERAAAELELVEGAGSAFSLERFLDGRCTPVLFGSAMWTFGVRQLLQLIVDLAPPPGARRLRDGTVRPVDAPFSGLVFKVQANLDPRHRDQLAYVRVCSGRFERGMRARIARTGRVAALTHAHDVFGRDREPLSEAFPGDVVGISGVPGILVGDTLVDGDPAAFEPIPTLVPDHLRTARPREASRRKQFVRGLEQLDAEGVVHVLRRTSVDDPVPVLGAVGDLQFEVLVHRMASEFGCPIELSSTPWRLTRRIDDTAEPTTVAGTEVLVRRDGTLLAAFADTYRMERFAAANPGVSLSRLGVRGVAPDAAAHARR
ncbi:MAG: peptide chain release factor 3 [Candidatus Nanopelagicales bacterium]